MSRPPLVIGVGNRDRGDDGFGPIVIDTLRPMIEPWVETYIAEGDLSDLALRWSPDHVVVVVDAMVSGRPAGSIVETDALRHRLATEDTLLSSHGVGLAEGIELGRLLDRLPKQLVVIGVEVERCGQFDTLTEAVADAVPVVTRRIVELLASCG